MNPEVKYSLWAGALYFVVANPLTYGLVNSVLGRVVEISGPGGATQAGTLIHAVVYGLLTFLLMKLGRSASRQQVQQE